MSVYIHHIATHTPPHTYSQDYVRDRLKAWTSNLKTRRLIHTVFNRSGIESRQSVSNDFVSGSVAELYRSDADGRLIPPTTAERNQVYAKSARGMAVAVARQALEGAGIAASEVTHVIFTSCTGFANPGPDYHMIRELGLPENVQRYTLGFMGCYAAFPTLRMAAQFCEAQPRAVVLAVCLELCTLHMRINDEPDSILANSLFADGAAAVVVSGRPPAAGKPAFRLRGFESSLVSGSEAEMAWDIGNEGFNIVLSSYVPDIIGRNLGTLLYRIMESHGHSPNESREWAVHPGGRAILDRVQECLGLEPAALDASRAVLRDYGNMSSATILFVLKELQDGAETPRANVCAMAFGPGLTVEVAFLERLGCPVFSPSVAALAGTAAALS